jgi:outer membrane protein
MKPIQNQIYNAVKAISESQGYSMVIDRASAQNIIFASPNIDISDEIIAKLGYSSNN